MLNNRRIRILDIPLDPIDMPAALEFVNDAIAQHKIAQYILAVNPEKVMALRQDASLRALFEKASLLIPDGIGVVMATRVLYGLPIRRVAGADLMQNICSLSAKKGYRIYIYGAAEDVNRGAVDVLQQRYPGINIVGRCNGYVKEEQMGDLIADINSSRTNVLFVALGSPKQEQWIDKWQEALEVNVCQGIGGTLDTIVGKVKRAPILFQRLGLEWFYRLLKEPARAGRQVALPVFLFLVLCSKIKRYSPT
ncbi:MAG: WecB/TagA/CpsF family glycosyltransferase [Smithellaceae bacterium]|nr:WecB/TagA/CpsF family glycosyltransferase [Smithellaceae bacterium]